MRPGNQNNKRMRGRGRKGPNPLSRTFESNGPDVKIRGTALHIAEKYQQLARDAQASGDRVMSENYLQHAEHYLRIVAAAQGQIQPAVLLNRSDMDDGDDTTPVTNGAGDRRERGGPSNLMDEDSPQPFIDDMPVIDASGQVSGHGGEDGSDEGDDFKSRRRARGTRGRGNRRDSAEVESAGEADGPAPAAASEERPAAEDEEAPRARPKRTQRARRAKPAEDADTEALAAGE